MKKKIASFVLSIMLLLQLAMPTVGAAEDIYFVAAGEYVLTLSDETMPFWRNGYLYISSTIFTGTARESLNVTYVYNRASDSVILYRDSDALVFEMSKDHAWDTADKIYYPGAIRKNGTIFVPAAVVAKVFNLQYSYTTVSRGHLIWLRRPEALQLPDSVFADAASIAMEERYNEYQKAKGLPVTSETPSAPGVVISGKAVYLCLRAGDDTAAMLDTLDRHDVQAAFFCDSAFMETQGGLLRRMTATGQTTGILVDAANEELSVLEQAERANELLEQATCGKSRLVRVENGENADVEALEAAGYRCLDEDLDRSGYALRTAVHADSLKKRIAARRGSSVVWLGENVNTVGLQALLRSVIEEDGQCLAWTVTT